MAKFALTFGGNSCPDDVYDTYKEAVREALVYARDRCEQGLVELDEGMDPNDALTRISDGVEIEIREVSDEEAERIRRDG